MSDRRYKARNNNGQIGLVPRNYLQELSEYLSQSYRGCPPTGDSIDRRNDQMNNSMSPPPPIANNANNQIERPNLAGKSWYYGAITRNQCDTVLNSHGHDGDFLIRDSETNVSAFIHTQIHQQNSHIILTSNRYCLLQMGDFSVSLKAPGRNKHFRVHVENGMYCIGQRKFHNLDQLGEYIAAYSASNRCS